MGENLIEAYTTPDYRDSVRAVISSAMQGVETSNFGTNWKRLDGSGD